MDNDVDDIPALGLKFKSISNAALTTLLKCSIPPLEMDLNFSPRATMSGAMSAKYMSLPLAFTRPLPESNGT